MTQEQRLASGRALLHTFRQMDRLAAVLHGQQKARGKGGSGEKWATQVASGEAKSGAGRCARDGCLLSARALASLLEAVASDGQNLEGDVDGQEPSPASPEATQRDAAAEAHLSSPFRALAREPGFQIWTLRAVARLLRASRTSAVSRAIDRGIRKGDARRQLARELFGVEDWRRLMAPLLKVSFMTVRACLA